MGCPRNPAIWMCLIVVGVTKISSSVAFGVGVYFAHEGMHSVVQITSNNLLSSANKYKSRTMNM